MSIYPPDEFKVDPYDITPEQLEEFLSLVIGSSSETEIDAWLKARYNKNNYNLKIITYDALIRKIMEAGQIQQKLPWLHKLRVNIFTTKPKDNME